MTSNDDRLVFEDFRDIEIHSNVREGGLETDTRRDIDVENKFLEGLLHTLVV